LLFSCVLIGIELPLAHK